MTRYLDRWNGVWEHHIEHGSRPWVLVSGTDRHTKSLPLGGYAFQFFTDYRHEDVKSLRPFINIETGIKVAGTTFYFPPDGPQPGDKVWIDQEWLYEEGVDYMQDYIGQPPRIGGIVKDSHGVNDNITVTVDILVPKDKVTKR